METKNIYQQGYDDFFQHIDRCPYSPHTTEAEEWLEGYKVARDEWILASIDIEMY